MVKILSSGPTYKVISIFVSMKGVQAGPDENLGSFLCDFCGKTPNNINNRISYAPTLAGLRTAFICVNILMEDYVVNTVWEIIWQQKDLDWSNLAVKNKP